MEEFYRVHAPWAKFTGRIRGKISVYNARDYLNATENYAQWFIEAHARRLCNYVGLDKSIGWVHQIRDEQSKESCVYDLQELGRFIGTLAVAQLVAENALAPQSFIVTDNYHIRLKKETGKLLIKRISDLMNERVPYKAGKSPNRQKQNIRYYSWENILMDSGMKILSYLLDASGAKRQSLIARRQHQFALTCPLPPTKKFYR
jgi:CRISP-associated protein Cas1